jgi:ech hydrogenase subunit A
MDTLNIVIFLILFPFFLSLASLSTRAIAVRRAVVVPANLALIVATLFLLARAPDDPILFTVEAPLIDHLLPVGEIAVGALILYLALRARRYIVALLAGAQLALGLLFEILFASMAQASYNLFVDRFSILMALIIGILGTLIVNYAVGYMAEYHHHYPEVRDRRRFFGFLIYLFLSAMFGLVFSNNLKWVYFFWEITTLCSFFLIGYRNDEPSKDSAFLALGINLLGGVAFSAGILYLFHHTGILELDRMLAEGKGYALIPAALLAFAGLAKSAQMPFSPWLTAAMVAPTPVSALLHSSTMVKAGVYLILKVSPLLNGTLAGIMLTFVGGVTFLSASFIAISQSNAKRVLAYSTISTLGLIVMCAGVGTYEAAWSALLLILFHAVAKSLLFLCVGVVEYKLGSRDIEDMDFLIVRMPKVAAMMNIGLAGMFLAPFGMLISKAVTLRALVDVHPLLGVILAFGSGATLFFYAKWMGKMLTSESGLQSNEDRISPWEWVTMVSLSGLTIAVCLLFPVITHGLVDPYIQGVYGIGPTLERTNLILIVVIMASLLVVFPAGLLYQGFRKDYRFVGPYLSGGNLEGAAFLGAMDQKRPADARNYYLANYFGESRILRIGLFVSAFFIIVMFGGVLP